MGRAFRAVVPVILLALGVGCGGRQELGGSGNEARTEVFASELSELLPGNTLHLVEVNGWADLEFFAGGRLAAENHAGERESGFWRIDDENRLCLRFRKWGHGDPTCYEVSRSEETYYFSSGGAIWKKGRIRSGNSGRSAAVHRPEVGKRKAAPMEKQEREAVSAPEPLRPALEPLPSPYLRQDNLALYRDMARHCPGCRLDNIDLAGADLAGAVLAGAQLVDADLTGANLKGANLKGAVLRGALLRRADLTGADLAGADLRGADLTEALLNRVELGGALTENAKGL